MHIGKEAVVQYSDELEIPLEAVVELAIQNLLERIRAQPKMNKTRLH
jgi:hypothetical protein